ncbi:hypothetical protein B1B04_01185 [Lysinibacillus sp. KCTC 33748]|uniref:glycosyltransferase family 61 protein n=1 Tax=unclassified Lysinibacillus TaxID=2636778 RepID=UPI0009A81F29|nr:MULTISPECIES: glycosyltransferase family 61 protein [unclassified Lysinibacillus]OXS77045.1 hypothetical protein B1B04_01185 [Lysinibacillus sp. KCTC 33748]SKB29171.1 Protein of unknown function [Lysinibacillus sp. AC-3]
MLFWEKVNNKKVILFGTGSSANKITSLLKRLNVGVNFYTDNNSSKWNTYFEGIQVISPDKIDKEKHIVIIASMYQTEIASQLDSMGLLEHQDYLYPGNIIKSNWNYLYIFEGGKTPKKGNMFFLDDYIKQYSGKIDIKYMIKNQQMKDFILPKSSFRNQYPSFIFPQQPRPSGDVFLLTIENGFTYGLNGATFDDEGNMIYELSTNSILNMNIWDARRVKQYDFERMKNPNPIVIKLDGKVGVTTTKWSGNNYYHWMVEELPRFKLLKDSGIELDYYLSNYQGYKYQDESLRLLGIDIKKIVNSSENYAIQGNQLIVPYSPAFDSGYVATWICDFLREGFLNKNMLGKNDLNKLYVTRGKTGNRKIVNEDLLIEMLKHQGFIICNMEDYGVKEQAQLFHNADVIVSAHGAALTNLVYCREGMKLLEIFNPIYVPTMYWALCSQVGIDYYFSLGERTDWECNETKTEILITKDVVVNLEEVARFLSENNL